MKRIIHFFKSAGINIKKYAVSHKIISTIIVLVIVGGGYWGYTIYAASQTQTLYVLGVVRRASVSETVSGTGDVTANDEVTLKSEGNGATVVEVDATDGEYVTSGQKIAVLDETDALISLAQAKAGLLSAQANYDKLIAGVTPQNMAVYQSQFSASQLSLSNSLQNLYNSLNTTYTSIFNTIQQETNPIYTNPTTSSPKLAFQTISQSAEIAAESARVDLTNQLNNWQASLTTVASSTDQADITTSYNNSQTYLSSINQDLTEIHDALASSVATGNVSQTTLTGYENNIDSAKSTVQSSISSLTGSYQSLESAVSSLNQQTASYNLNVAPPAQADIDAAQASLSNAQASLQSAQEAYDKNIVVAPFSGQIGSVSVHVGDQASGATIATIITTDKVVEVPLDEVDAAKVQVGNPATLTFDALPNLVATGTVAEIDTIGTVSQGVVTYNVKIDYPNSDPSIKAGMSSSATIIVQTDANVLVVPSQAVKTSGSISTVQVVSASSTPFVSRLGGSRSASSTAQFGNGSSTNPYSGFASSSFATSTGSSTFTRGAGASSSRSTASQGVTLSTPPTAVRVTIGLSDDINTEIVSGLTVGQIVVVKTTTSTGTTVKPTTTTSAAGAGGAGALFGAAGGSGRAAGGGGTAALSRP